AILWARDRSGIGLFCWPLASSCSKVVFRGSEGGGSLGERIPWCRPKRDGTSHEDPRRKPTPPHDTRPHKHAEENTDERRQEEVLLRLRARHAQGQKRRRRTGGSWQEAEQGGGRGRLG